MKNCINTIGLIVIGFIICCLLYWLCSFKSLISSGAPDVRDLKVRKWESFPTKKNKYLIREVKLS